MGCSNIAVGIVRANLFLFLIILLNFDVILLHVAVLIIVHCNRYSTFGNKTLLCIYTSCGIDKFLGETTATDAV